MKGLFANILRKQRPSSQIKVQVISDLHLEVGKQYSSYTFPACAPFLLLGWDIGRLVDYDEYLRFIELQASRFRKIFLVLGNHEFYGLDYESGLKKAQELTKEPTLSGKLVLLHRTRWDDPNSSLTILGCTLWSRIPEEVCDLVETKINDFKRIQGWTSHRHNAVHAEEVQWLHDQVAHTATCDSPLGERRILIATHHAPCIEGTSRPTDSSNLWTSAFATDLLDQHDWNVVQVWAFGHTHYSTDMSRNGVRLVANQRGYVLPGSSTQQPAGKSSRRNPDKFDPEKVVTL